MADGVRKIMCWILPSRVKVTHSLFINLQGMHLWSPFKRIVVVTDGEDFTVTHNVYSSSLYANVAVALVLKRYLAGGKYHLFDRISLTIRIAHCSTVQYIRLK